MSLESLQYVLREVIPALLDTYRSIDMRGILARSNIESKWRSIVLKIRLTKDSTTKLKEIHNTKEKKLGTIRRDKFKIVFENREIGCLNDILHELQKGVITLDGHQTELIGIDFQNIFHKEMVNSSLYVAANEECGYLHKMVFTSMPENPEQFTRRTLRISEEDQGIGFSQLHSWLDANPNSLINPNNVLLIFPIYCKRLNLLPDERGKFLAKYNVHKSLQANCIAKAIVFQKEQIVERLEFQLVNQNPSLSDGDTVTITLPITQISEENYVTIAIYHKTLNILLTEDTVYSSTDILQVKGISLLRGFNQFRAGRNFAEYIFSSDNKKQEVSTTWLLSLLGFATIELGGYHHEDEKIYDDDRYAADILACNVDRQIFLAVDCTKTVPHDNKVDKIRNAAEEINKRIGENIFIPVIFSTVDCKSSIPRATNVGVVIIDQGNIQYFSQMFSQTQMDKAKQFFFKLIRERQRVAEDL